MTICTFFKSMFCIYNQICKIKKKDIFNSRRKKKKWLYLKAQSKPETNETEAEL